jgi:hypothetical protein
MLDRSQVRPLFSRWRTMHTLDSATPSSFPSFRVVYSLSFRSAVLLALLSVVWVLSPPTAAISAASLAYVASLQTPLPPSHRRLSVLIRLKRIAYLAVYQDSRILYCSLQTLPQISLPTADSTAHCRLYYPSQTLLPIADFTAHCRLYCPLQTLLPTADFTAHCRLYCPPQTLLPNADFTAHRRLYCPPQTLLPTADFTALKIITDLVAHQTSLPHPLIAELL